MPVVAGIIRFPLVMVVNIGSAILVTNILM